MVALMTIQTSSAFFLYFLINRRIQYQYSLFFSMSHKKSEGSTPWQSSTVSPIYLDTAYKELLRQELKAAALKNRTKVLNINQEHILKQVENNHNKLEKLNQIKHSQTQENQMLSRDKQKKNQLTQQQKKYNEVKRINHERQMSSVIAQKMEERDKIRGEAKRMRKENQRLIEANRSQQHAKKKQIRNKIHDDIMESRSTIKNFFASKHQKIVLNTQQQIQRLNHKRIKQELMALSCSGKIVEEMQNQMKEMKSTLKDSRLGIELKRQESSLNIKKKTTEDPHPLVKKIETVMNIYTKFL